MKSTILKFFKFLFNPFSSNSITAPFRELLIPLNLEQSQMLTRVIEKSGVKNVKELLAQALYIYEDLVDHELNGGSVEMVEPDGVGRQRLDFLRRLNKTNDD